MLIERKKRPQYINSFIHSMLSFIHAQPKPLGLERRNLECIFFLRFMGVVRRFFLKFSSQYYFALLCHKIQRMCQTVMVHISFFLLFSLLFFISFFCGGAQQPHKNSRGYSSTGVPPESALLYFYLFIT